MTSKIITVCNQKGGVGKTTLVMQLASAFSRRGKKVLVVDADPQATATRWAASAEDATSFPASVIGLSAAHDKVHREVKKFINDYDLIFIDCPPAADSPIPQSALLISDLAIVPLSASPLDMWASVGIRKIIENVAEINESLEARLVVNQCQPHTTLAREALEILPEFGIKLFDNFVRQRTVYRQCAVFGQSVHDFGSRAQGAINEIEGLADEINEIINV